MTQTPTSPPGSAFRLRVLVIDDNADGAESLCAVLAVMGCTTAMAFDGEHGLALAASFQPQLALIDLEMPGMSGCEVAQKLRTGSPPTVARLVCLTGRSADEARRRCIDAGFDDFFTKPMRPEHLSALVAAATPSSTARVAAVRPNIRGTTP